jgi:hypothetical protein
LAPSPWPLLLLVLLWFPEVEEVEYDDDEGRKGGRGSFWQFFL